MEMMKNDHDHVLPFVFVLGAITLICGCGADVTWIATHSPSRAMKPRTPEQVNVYVISLPDRQYEEVGLINGKHANGAFSGRTNDEILLEVRRFAAQKGCDAIIITDRTNNFISSGTNQKGYEATCVLWH